MSGLRRDSRRAGQPAVRDLAAPTSTAARPPAPARRTGSGCCSARAMIVIPPIECPTSTSGPVRRERTQHGVEVVAELVDRAARPRRPLGAAVAALVVDHLPDRRARRARPGTGAGSARSAGRARSRARARPSARRARPAAARSPRTRAARRRRPSPTSARPAGSAPVPSAPVDSWVASVWRSSGASRCRLRAATLTAAPVAAAPASPPATPTACQARRPIMPGPRRSATSRVDHACGAPALPCTPVTTS